MSAHTSLEDEGKENRRNERANTSREGKVNERSRASPMEASEQAHSSWMKSAWIAMWQDLGRGVREDYFARQDLYASDWTDAWRTSHDLVVVVRAALYMATITFVTTATLGALYDIETDNEIGMTASFASTGITGLIGALMGTWTALPILVFSCSLEEGKRKGNKKA